jgi:hypothetical protein
MTHTPLKSAFDRAIFSVVTRGWGVARVDSYFRDLERQSAAMPTEVASTLQNVDSKATGLLTHVSMMIAGLGLVAPLVADNEVEVGIIIVEMAFYLLIAIGCLRCLSIFRSREFVGTPDDMQDMINHELILRRELYITCNRAAIILTAVVFLLLPVLFVWKPEH